jgi:beta-catenin-like protein 1
MKRYSNQEHEQLEKRSKPSDNADSNDINELVDSLQDIPEITNLNDIKKLVLKLEKLTDKNTQLRLKYPDDPLKFMDSEIDIASTLKSLMSIKSEMFNDLTKTSLVASIVKLLNHENSDIVSATVELTNELLDYDENPDPDDMQTLIDHLLKHDVHSILFNVLESTRDDQVIFNILEIFENIISYPSYIKNLLDTKIITWLLNTISKKEFHGNKLYSSELLAIFSRDEDVLDILVKNNAVDLLLQQLAKYRKKDPKGTNHPTANSRNGRI